MIADLRNGGKLAFKQIKSEPAPPVHTFSCKKHFVVKRSRWTKQGRKTLHVQDGHQIDPRWPVIFQGQVRSIISCKDDIITLDAPVSLRNETLLLIQNQILVEPKDMHEQLFTVWNQYFQRDSWDGVAPQDFQLPELLKCVPEDAQLQLEPITGSDLLHAIHKTKIVSSRGSDGFSTNDLRKLPLQLFELLAIIFQLTEQTGQWPVKWTLARTICLAKVLGQCTAADIRPITIMSKLYRLLGRIRGSQVSKWSTRNLHSKIGGPCKGISADCIALLTAQIVESAVIDQIPLMGTVIDTIKRYNFFPWRDPLVFTGKAGCPNQHPFSIPCHDGKML